MFASPTTAGNFRKVVSVQVTDGTILTAGTIGWWAVTDNDAGRLLAHGGGLPCGVRLEDADRLASRIV
jgi:hypothetical protein